MQAKRGFDDLRNHYTLHGDDPTATSPSFDDVVCIPQPGTLKVIPFRHGLRYDNASVFTLVRNLASGHAMTFAQPPAKEYAPGAALVDGVIGSADFHDGRWAAWHDGDLEATIDLQKAAVWHTIEVGFWSEPHSRILLPEEVTYAVSSDGQHWKPLYHNTLNIALAAPAHKQSLRFHSEQAITARYVRIKAMQRRAVPAEFAGGAKDIWLFADEVLVQ